MTKYYITLSAVLTVTAWHEGKSHTLKTFPKAKSQESKINTLKKLWGKICNVINNECLWLTILGDF